MGMAGSQEHEQSDDRLSDEMAVLRFRTRESMRRLADVAARIAQTEDEVVRVHEEIARNSGSALADQALEQAERARRFGEQERREQQRWSARSEED
jgi:hypothetical protein